MTNDPHGAWVDGDLLHEIHSDLVYFGDVGATRRAIVSALIRLPDEVRDYALWGCRFLSVGGKAAYVVSGAVGTDPSTRRTRDVWLVILRDSADNLEDLVAQQVAHAWLRRSQRTHLDGDQHANEKAADALCRVWGFTPAEAEASSRPYGTVTDVGEPLIGWIRLP